jgi:plastocyanin
MGAASVDAGVTISERGKRFAPEEIRMLRGGDITLVNDDDAAVTHFAYIDAPALAYDSGDMAPGAKALIRFPAEGDFQVLCGVDPKMRLIVHVR